MLTSIVEALKANNLYRESGRIEEQMLKTILPNGEVREHKMAEIDYLDIKIFADELDIALKLQNPLVQSLFAKNATGLVNLIRAVNVETASGFKGAVGSGRQLDALLLRAEQHQNPDIAGIAARTSWIRNIAAIGGLQFICAADAVVAPNIHGALQMTFVEGYALLGFANTAAAPCIDAFQITYLVQAYNIQNLDFELANPFIGDAICELKQPLFIYPQESALIQTYYYQVGQDETRPIGLWIKMAQNFRALATS